MAKDWDSAFAAATKILGKNGKIPPPKSALSSANDAYDVALKNWRAAQASMEDVLDELDAANDKKIHQIKMYLAVIEKSDLGYEDEDEKETAKKLQAARKLLVDFLDGVVTRYSNAGKSIDELEKHVTLVAKYEKTLEQVTTHGGGV